MSEGRAAAAGRVASLLARCLVGATALLIVAGGLVTSSGAALAVPDWPTTFGFPLWRVPWAVLGGGALFEHSHRLLGALVGLLTLVVAGVVWVVDRRIAPRVLATGAVALVCLQGLLGGLRVLWRADALGMVHGAVAPALLALVSALAVVAGGPGRRSPALPARGPRLTGLAALTGGALYVQILLGVLTTHAGWVGLHLAGAVGAVGAGGALAHRVLASGSRPSLAPLGRLLAALLGLQVLLGAGAYLVRFTPVALPGGAAAALALPVAHRLVGALLLGATVALALRAWHEDTSGSAPAAGWERAAQAAGPAVVR